MQISGADGIAQLSTEWASKSASAPPSAAAARIASRPSSNSEPSASASFSVPIENSTGNAHESTLVVSYSPSVNGTRFLASVEDVGGVYVASVPSPPGYSATGSSVEAAETNLEIELDILA